jgi:uncharacterized protein
MSMRVSSYIIGAPLADDRFFLLLHGLRGSLDKVSASTGAYLVDQRGGGIVSPPWDADGHTEKHLKERGYLTDLSEEQERGLMVDVATVLHEAQLESSPPSFVFVPAYTCNLRCPYCFQSHQMHAGKGAYATVMTRERVDEAFLVIDRFDRPGAVSRSLALLPRQENEHPVPGRPGRKLGLFGGEPLQEATRDIVEYIVKQARDRGSRMWAITNGVQLDLFTALLGPTGLAELQITLDGMADLHDRRRVSRLFRRTFHRIVDNIDLALDSGAQVNLRINVDGSNADNLAMLNDFFLERGWSKHAAFSAAAAVVTDEAAHQPLVSHADLVELTSVLRAERGGSVRSYEGYAESVLASALAGGYPFRRGVNCSAETGLLMFDPLGDLYGCWEEIGIAERRIGHYRGGVLDLDEKVASAWLSRFPGAIEQCSRCPYALIHSSGCAKHARDESGSMFAAACEGFQSFFPRTLAESYEKIEKQVFGESLTAGKSTSRAA